MEEWPEDSLMLAQVSRALAGVQHMRYQLQGISVEWGHRLLLGPGELSVGGGHRRVLQGPTDFSCPVSFQQDGHRII